MLIYKINDHLNSLGKSEPILSEIKPGSNNDPMIRNKMAAFDYDWTLVNPKDGKTFPSNIDDWQWLYPCVPEKIKEYYNNGYMIVIFTNQSKKWKYDQIKLVATQLNIPLFIVIATDKEEYKPNLVLYNILFENKNINKDESFFVGDALGRKSDFSDSDKVFAENIGIKYYSPEAIFYKNEKINMSMTSHIPFNNPEIIILVGYPGSGKSTVALEICKNQNYNIVAGDIYKTSSKMIKKSLEYILQGKSVIFDATNSSIKKRKEYIDFANKHNYKVKCIHVSTDLDTSYKRNKLREDDVPKIAYSVYTKYYEPPNENEGFKLYTV